MNNKRILWITQTAIFIALLITIQAVTRPFGQFVTGSCVNFILVASGILSGLASAAAVAVISPLFAFLIIGVPAFPLLIPFMMAGNLVLVLVIHFISGKQPVLSDGKGYLKIGVAAVAGAVAKFLVLWIGIVRIALSLIPGIKQPQIDAMSATFSWPQLVTALIGSGLAITIMPTLTRALRFNRQS